MRLFIIYIIAQFATVHIPCSGPCYNIIILSIVIPVYNEEVCILPFFDSLRKSVVDIENYEIIYVNDGSSDGSLELLQQLAHDYSNVKVVALAKNFGKEAALTAGIDTAQGDAILTIDSDGEHRVELIPEFYQEWKNGAQVVIGIRKNLSKVGVLKRITSKVWGWVSSSIMEGKMPSGLTDFCLIDREVADALESMSEKERMVRALIHWVGFNRKFIEFNASTRIGGTPSYNFKKLYKLSIDSITSMSTFPLLLIMHFGLLMSFISFLLDAFLITEKYFIRDPFEWDISGAAIISVSVVFLVGIILSAQGILGLYISKINTETKNRPLYIVNRRNCIL
ncbi:glycosyl transferase [Actinomycetota bacterium]|nr:glycosyl transferase [Actinomycetota bacterium]